VVEQWINKTQSSRVSSKEIRPIRKKGGWCPANESSTLASFLFFILHLSVV
jgi:hypothetical protein